MKNMILMALLCVSSLFSMNLMSQEIVGFWKTISDETNKPQSIVAIYEYQNKYYGRLIATYDESGAIKDTIEKPSARAPAIKGNPYYVGLDFIYDLEKEGSKYTNGVILDPEQGDEYAAEAWIENGNLIMRGEIFFIGKNQTWPPIKDSDLPAGFKKPDLKTMVPKIPEPIES